MTAKLRVTLVTGRTIGQGITREAEKGLGTYVESAAICQLDPRDLERLGVKEGDTVRVRTRYGSVVVRAVKSDQAPHPGVAFIPMGPWANQVIGPATEGMGTPSYKGVEAELEPAPGEQVLDARSLLERGRG